MLITVVSAAAPLTHTSSMSSVFVINPSSRRYASGVVSRQNPRRPKRVAVSGLAPRAMTHIDFSNTLEILSARGFITG